MSIRILIADGQSIVRSGIRYELSKCEDLQVLEEVQNGDDALQLILELAPDILLLDINLPGMKACQILCRIQMAGLATCVVVFTINDDALKIQEMLKAGVKGYVMKDDDPADLITAIRVVMRGKTWLSSTVAEILAGSLVNEGANKKEQTLTAREMAILQLLSKGFCNDKIGEELFISERIVRYLVGKIIEKLGVRNRTEAVAVAVKNGLI